VSKASRIGRFATLRKPGPKTCKRGNRAWDSAAGRLTLLVSSLASLTNQRTKRNISDVWLVPRDSSGGTSIYPASQFEKLSGQALETKPHHATDREKLLVLPDWAPVEPAFYLTTMDVARCRQVCES